MKVADNKRNDILSLAVTKEELTDFNKCRKKIEDKNDIRISTSKFIREYILLPYLKNNSYLPDGEIRQSQTKLHSTTTVNQESKPDSEQKPKIGDFASLLDDL